MPIPANLIFDLSVVILGTSSTGGAGAKNVYNTFTYARQSSVPAFTKLSFFTAFGLNVIVPLAAAMNVRWSANNVNIRILNDFTDPEVSFASAAVGARVLDSLPLNSAVTVQKKTSLRGKSYRGNVHFSPASEEDTTQDILTGAGLARWQAVRDAVGASFVDTNGNTWFPTVYSRLLSTPNAMPVAIIEANQVTQVILDLNLGTMRRRRSRTLA